MHELRSDRAAVALAADCLDVAPYLQLGGKVRRPRLQRIEDCIQIPPTPEGLKKVLATARENVSGIAGNQSPGFLHPPPSPANAGSFDSTRLPPPFPVTRASHAG